MNINKFKKMRIKLGLSQEDLAKRLDVSIYTVVNCEREPTDEIMIKMNELLKLEEK